MRSTQPPRPGDLLVLDDDPAIRALLREAFREEGYRVLAARSLADGLAALRTFRVDLVLTDAFRTDEPDPWSALLRVREQARATPVVICSAHGEHGLDGYAERGFAALVPKPFDLDALGAVIRQAIARSRAARPGRPAAWSLACGR
jgi:two-component system KDP operon response regulator KdpE